MAVPAPTVSAWALAQYARLPETLRAADPDLGWPLLKLVASWSANLDRLRTLVERLDPARPATPPGGLVPATPRSQLVDPVTADEAWLTWMAQFLGALAQPGAVLSREALGATSFDHGSNEAMRVAVRATLDAATTRVVRVGPDPSATGDAVGWSILVETYRRQTPDEAASLRAALLELPATHAVRLNVLTGQNVGQLAASGATVGQLATRTVYDVATEVPA